MGENTPDRTVPRDLPRREIVSAHGMAQSSPYHTIVPIDDRDREISVPLDAAASIFNHVFERLWDDVIAYAAEAGPMPLVGTQEWVEGDAEYEARLPPEYCPCALVAEDGELDALGAEIGLPRARLVRRD